MQSIPLTSVAAFTFTADDSLVIVSREGQGQALLLTARGAKGIVQAFNILRSAAEHVGGGPL